MSRSGCEAAAARGVCGSKRRSAAGAVRTPQRVEVHASSAMAAAVAASSGVESTAPVAGVTNSAYSSGAPWPPNHSGATTTASASVCANSIANPTPSAVTEATAATVASHRARRPAAAAAAADAADTRGDARGDALRADGGRRDVTCAPR